MFAIVAGAQADVPTLGACGCVAERAFAHARELVMQMEMKVRLKSDDSPTPAGRNLWVGRNHARAFSPSAEVLAQHCNTSDGAGGIEQWRDYLGPATLARNALLHNPAHFYDGGGYFYQFGVLLGHSIRDVHRTTRPEHVIGFDSFKGLPEEPDESERVKFWYPGAFSGDPRAQLTHGLPGAEVHWVAGYYNESLAPPGLAASLRMRPASYLDIDVDLYTSSAQALEFMLSHGLLRAGALVGYDDWWILACGGRGAAARCTRMKAVQRGATQPVATVALVCTQPASLERGALLGAAHDARAGVVSTAGSGVVSPLTVGEGRAHKEAAEKHLVEFACVAGPCSHRAVGEAEDQCSPFRIDGPGIKKTMKNMLGVIFVVLSVGVRAQHGFEMDEAQLGAFGERPKCKGVQEAKFKRKGRWVNDLYKLPSQQKPS